ncbi:expressed unknown protein [Seminavis robusta]|uniref:Uncharacterized protein n=1 Tax=Seminavis robusta TaxID=568900 RepID=A0A9N8DX43_9STRA|nr:expressed unknown protein [Seminavis robusta]|eukprot:Sro431_g141460.1 n/a (140) ;mRNA; r:37680-38099
MKVLLSIALMALSFGSGQAQSTPPPADGNGYCCGRSTQDSLALCDPCTAGNTCPPAVTCEPMPTYCAAFGLTHCGPFSNACCQGATTIVSACGDRESEEVCFLAPPTTPTPPNTPVHSGGVVVAAVALLQAVREIPTSR